MTGGRAVASDPLVVAEVTTVAERGKVVLIECKEPAPCMRSRLAGTTAVVHAAIEALERIHQSVHALREQT